MGLPSMTPLAAAQSFFLLMFRLVCPGASLQQFGICRSRASTLSMLSLWTRRVSQTVLRICWFSDVAISFEFVTLVVSLRNMFMNCVASCVVLLLYTCCCAKFAIPVSVVLCIWMVTFWSGTQVLRPGNDW